MSLADVQDLTADCMDKIKACFKPGVKITVAVRSPDHPTRDFLMTDDDPNEVKAMLDQRLASGAKEPAPRMRCHACNAPRAVSPCHKCGGPLEPTPDSWEYPDLPDVERIRAVAREVGYAVGVHGSLERDLDLIAVPWTDTAVLPEELAEHIAKGINARVLAPEDKPVGRWSCNIQIDGWFKVIDLSVMPPAMAWRAVDAETPRETLVLVRIEGIHTGKGIPYTPIVAQLVQHYGEPREAWFTTDNELDAIQFDPPEAWMAEQLGLPYPQPLEWCAIPPYGQRKK